MRTATRRFALWRADLEGGVCAAPEECVEKLSGRETVEVVLDHREYGVIPTRQTFGTTLREDGEWQFSGLVWPGDLRPCALVIVTWQASKSEIVVRTIPLDEPLRVDGVDYFHEYDPKVATREYEAGPSNRGKVLATIRRAGRVFSDGSAVLAEAGLGRRSGLGRGTKATFLLDNALDQLIREGYLTRVEGSLDSSGYPSYPAVDGQKAAPMLFYAPLVEPIEHPADRSEHTVHSFVRKLPPGAHATGRQVSAHERAMEEDEIETRPLEPGYTFVKKHHRGTNS